MKKMKKIFIPLILLFSIIVITSCHDFLTEVNPNAITTGSFWKTGNDARQGLAATYGILQYSNVMGGTGVTSGLASSDIGRANIWEASPLALQEFSYNETNPFLTQRWNQLYIGVFRANQVLEFVPNINMDEKVKGTIIAETYFLRGLYLYWLMESYNQGSIPLPTIVPQKLSDYNKPLATREEVYDQVLSDLSFAADAKALPDRWDDINLGRATWGAAQGILGQFYLYEQKWDLAAKQFEKIIARKDLYELVDDIGWNFDIEHEWNKESIFEVNFSDIVKPGTNAYVIDSPTGSETTNRPMIVGGWGILTPSAYIRELYMNDPVDQTVASNIGRVYSKRCEASIYFKDAGYPYYVNADGTTNEQYLERTVNASIKKFQNWKGRIREDGTNYRSGINERVLRLADVYLMYAEALVQRDGDSKAATAVTYINYVRSRSGVTPLNASDYNTKDKIMNHLMYVERPLELAWEGFNIRWYDLRRWGKIKPWLTDLASRTWKFPDTGPIKQFGNSAANFQPKHYYFPIPNVETNSNPYIKN